jgi:hypothetical protein
LHDLFCNEIRLVPKLSLITEQKTVVVKTPQYENKYPKKGLLLMAFVLTDTQQVVVALEIKDKKGNSATVDGAPVWSVDNSELLALTPSADGLTCTVVAVGPLGTANVTVKADADLGAGVENLIGALVVEITGGVAAVINLVPGTPVEQP